MHVKNCRDVCTWQHVVEAKSSFLESLMEARNKFEKVVKEAHQVGGVLCRHQSQMCKAIPCCSTRGMRTVTTQRKRRCTCDEQLECETKDPASCATSVVISVFLKPEHAHSDSDK